MNLALKRIGAYVKLLAILLVAVALVMILYYNRRHETSIWFFWIGAEEATINVVSLMFYTALATLFVYWVLGKFLGVRRELKQISREANLREKEKEFDRRRKELEEQEKRIDEKLQKGLSNNEKEKE